MAATRQRPHVDAEAGPGAAGLLAAGAEGLRAPDGRPPNTDRAFWTAIMGIGAVQGCFLAITLLVQRNPNRRASRTLAAMVGAFTLIILGELGERLLPSSAVLLASLGISIGLTFGPLTWLFVRFALDAGRGWRRRDGLHFLPALAGTVGWAAAWATASDDIVFEPVLTAATPPYVAFKAGVMVAYAVATYRTLARGLVDDRCRQTGNTALRLYWLRRWIVVVCGVAVVTYACIFLERWGLPLPVEADQVGNLVLTAIIYLASLMVLLRPWVLAHAAAAR